MSPRSTVCLQSFLKETDQDGDWHAGHTLERDWGVHICLGAEVEMGEERHTNRAQRPKRGAPLLGWPFGVVRSGDMGLDLDTPSSTRPRMVDALGKGVNLDEGFLWLRGSRRVTAESHGCARQWGRGDGGQSRSAGGGGATASVLAPSRLGAALSGAAHPAFLPGPDSRLAVDSVHPSSKRVPHTRLSLHQGSHEEGRASRPRAS